MNKRGEAAPCTSRENNQAKEEQSRKEKKDWNKPAQLSQFLEVKSKLTDIHQYFDIFGNFEDKKFLRAMVKLKSASFSNSNYFQRKFSWPKIWWTRFLKQTNTNEESSWTSKIGILSE